MSGIFGIFSLDGKPANSQELHQLSNCLARRGNDGHGLWVKGPIGLGHRMLHTTPESLFEKLPYLDDQTGLVITCDARIDNREDLGGVLGVNPRIKEGMPDSQLILAAFNKWGTECPKYLLGDFSFAIWDKTKQRLFCATDCFGIRPFCYSHHKKRLVFSSDIQGLIQSGITANVLVETRLAGVFVDALSGIDADASLYQNTYYLPPAHCLIASPEGVDVRAYWSTLDIQDVRFKNDDEYRSGFYHVLETAIRSRLRSTGPTALALSGGIDSVSIAALSQGILAGSDQKQVYYSGIATAGVDCLETDCIHAAQSAFDQDSVEFTPSFVKDNLSQLLGILNSCHLPRGISSLFLLCLYLRVSQDGHKVMLDGAEGDTVLGLGDSYIAQLIRQGMGVTAIREAFQYSRHSYAGAISPLRLISSGIKQVLRPHIPVALKSLYHHQTKSRRAPGLLPLNKSFITRIDLETRLNEKFLLQRQVLSSSSQTLHKKNLNQPYFGRMYVSLDLLSSQFGLELRHPYLDKRLVEFALGMPMRFKNHQGWEKCILRDVGPNLPPEIRWRTKRTHVGWQFLKMFREAVETELTNAIKDPGSPIYNFVDFAAMQPIYTRYRISRGDVYADNILEFYGINNWLKQYT